MTQLPRVHVVTNDRVLATKEFLSISTSLMREPIALHLRGRSTAGIELQTLAKSLQPTGSGTAIVINDRLDIAVTTGAWGVHLPEAGLPIDRVKNMYGNDLAIGVSTHSPGSATKAIDAGADYVFLGPVWQTVSHPDTTPVGIGAISEVTHGKVVAIGGVTVERISKCVEAGAYGVAAISAVWDAADPVSVVRAMCDIFQSRSN